MRLAFAGTPQFAATALAALLDAGHNVALVLTQPERPAGRGMRLAPSPVKQLATARGIEVDQPVTLKDAAAQARIAALRAEALVVAAYGLILPPALLNLSGYGAVNIHASLLPRWRGAAPVQRALLAGDEETGITIMQMDEGLDTGPILAQRALRIAPQDDAASLLERLAALGAEMIVTALREIAAGSARPQTQLAGGVTYARKIDKAETALDWSRPAAELARAVRAFNPSPGARASWGSESLKIWRAQVTAGRGAPGEVLGADAGGVVIACGEQALCVSELQRAGGKRLDAGAFLRGHALRPGERFGRAAN